jgi:hypothetical protein
MVKSFFRDGQHLKTANLGCKTLSADKSQIVPVNRTRGVTVGCTSEPADHRLIKRGDRGSGPPTFWTGGRQCVSESPQFGLKNDFYVHSSSVYSWKHFNFSHKFDTFVTFCSLVVCLVHSHFCYSASGHQRHGANSCRYQHSAFVFAK